MPAPDARINDDSCSTLQLRPQRCDDNLQKRKEKENVRKKIRYRSAKKSPSFVIFRNKIDSSFTTAVGVSFFFLPVTVIKAANKARADFCVLHRA